MGISDLLQISRLMVIFRNSRSCHNDHEEVGILGDCEVEDSMTGCEAGIDE